MPRAGYDLTGTAPGSAAAEAAARARQRTAPGNRTPRAGTPANPSRPDGDNQETPRASRISISASAALVDPATYYQMNFGIQDPRVLQIQRRQPRRELYQNPLNINPIQAASQSMTRPINARYGHGVSLEAQSSMFLGTVTPTSSGHSVGLVNAPTSFGATNFRSADSRAQQQQQLWSNGQYYALPVSQHEIQIRPSAYPNPGSSNHNQAATGLALHLAPGSMSAGNSAYRTAEEDAEMESDDSRRY